MQERSLAGDHHGGHSAVDKPVVDKPEIAGIGAVVPVIPHHEIFTLGDPEIVCQLVDKNPVPDQEAGFHRP